MARSTQTATAAANGAPTVPREDHAADWEQFQAFVAAVDQDDDAADQDATSKNDAPDGEEKDDDGSARDAEQSLENMAYVDRFRQALEHATTPAKVSTAQQGRGGGAQANGTKREHDGVQEISAEAIDKEEEGQDMASIVRAAAMESAKRRRLVQQPGESSDDEDQRQGSDDEGENSDSLDLSNWRSKRID